MSAGRFKLAEAKTVTIVGLLGALCGIIGLPLFWSSTWKYPLALAIILVSCLALFLEKEWRSLSLFGAGIVEYRRLYEPRHNAEVFSLVEKEYSYLGVSFLTTAEHFCAWYGKERPTQFKARILLTDPDAGDLLRLQQFYREGKSPAAVPASANGREERSRVIASLRTLAALQAASDYIEVGFHHEKLHEWMHIIDDHVICLGLLEFGESGRSCPLLVLKNKRGAIYDSYRAWFECLWQSAAKVDLAAWRDSSGASE